MSEHERVKRKIQSKLAGAEEFGLPKDLTVERDPISQEQKDLEIIRTHIESLPVIQGREVHRIADIMRELLARNTCAALALVLIGAELAAQP